jgi:hypothetical protein
MKPHYLALVAAAFLAACSFSGPAKAQPSPVPCQWNYSFSGNVANATYCGIVSAAGGVTIIGVPSISVLEAIVAPYENEVVSVNCYYSTGQCTGGGIFYYSSASLTNDNGIIFPASDGKHWVRQGVNGRVINTWYGSRTDDSIDDTASTQAAYTGAAANGITTVELAAPYARLDSAVIFVPGASVTTIIDGEVDCGHVVRTEVCFTNADSSAYQPVGNIAFQGGKIYGDWLLNKSEGTHSLIDIRTCDSFTADRVELAYGRFFGWQVTCTRIKFTNNFTHDVVRDMANFTNSTDALIEGNTQVGGNDDCISDHVANTQTSPRFDIKIINNTCIDTFGIDYLGPKVATIAGNHITLPKRYGLQLSYTSSEGETAQIGSGVFQNVVMDAINPVIFGLPNLPATYALIGSYGAPGSGGTLPGTSTGTAILAPFSYNWNTSNNSSGTTVSPGTAFNFSDNQFLKSRTTVATYSAFGVTYAGTYCLTNGQAFTSTGCYNGAVSDDNLDATGIIVTGSYLWNADFHDNIISPGEIGINFVLLCNTTNSTRNVGIYRNTFENTISGGILFACGTVTNFDIAIKSNLFDLDPYFRVTGSHNANGTWINNTILSTIDMRDALGIAHCGNTYLNTYLPYNTNSGTVEYGCDSGEILRGLPVAIGYNANNVGVGNFIGGNQLQATNGDGTSANYGNTLSSWSTIGADPTGITSYHYTGEFMRNSAPVCTSPGSGTTIVGFTALTTGNANTLNTDYVKTKGTC